MEDTSIQSKLKDLLVGRNLDPETTETKGGEIFKFDYISTANQNYGTVVIVLANNQMDVYFGDNVGRTMEGNDKKEWFQFLEQLKLMAVRYRYAFSTQNLHRLKYALQTMATVKEGLFESFNGNSNTSFSDTPQRARIMIRHNKKIQEGDARFRYIESIFIETEQGERFKLPFVKLSGAKAMLEHVRQGGRPYDLRGQHISNIVNELNVLSRFHRAHQSKLFEGEALAYIQETTKYYESLKKNIKSISGSKGYRRYFEAWRPDEVKETEFYIEGIKKLFIEQTLDTRIESALPIIAKLVNKDQSMKEVSVFENFIDNLAEGTWALPDTPEEIAKLKELLSKELIVGADAANATEQLYDIVGDDELFDLLGLLAEANPDANAWDDPSIMARIEELVPGITGNDSKVDEADNLSVLEGGCNMSEAGVACPVHGLEECYSITTATPPLAESFDTTLTRIKTLLKN